MSKPILLLSSLALLLGCGSGALYAQDSGEKVAVPLDDPSRPVRVHVHLLSGGVSIRGTDAKTVTVETSSASGEHSRRPHRTDSKANGMKQLEFPGNGGLDIVEQDNLVTIKSGVFGGPVNVTVTVPRHSSLQLKCMNNGDIVVEGVDGEIDANNLNGSITLKNVAGSVLAHSMNGEVKASLDRIDAGKPMSFSTMNGDIDVTLPSSLTANVLMKTDHGEIYSDFEVKLANAGGVVTKSGRQSDGSYHLQFDHALRGSINGGGPEFKFTSFNGEIYLRRKK